MTIKLTQSRSREVLHMESRKEVYSGPQNREPRVVLETVKVRIEGRMVKKGE